MRRWTPRTWIVTLALLGGTTLLVRELAAEIPTVKGIGKVLTSFAANATVSANGTVNLVAVPADRTCVITDLIVSNGTASAATLEIQDLEPGVSAPKILPPVQVAAKFNFDHLFGTGLEFKGGHNLRVQAVGGPLEVFVSGYLRK